MGAYLEDLKKNHTSKRVYAVGIYEFDITDFVDFEGNGNRIIYTKKQKPEPISDWWPEEKIIKELAKEKKYEIMDTFGTDIGSVYENIEYLIGKDRVHYDDLLYLIRDDKGFKGLCIMNTLMWI